MLIAITFFVAAVCTGPSGQAGREDQDAVVSLPQLSGETVTRRLCILEAMQGGRVVTVNGLAISSDFRVLYATHWRELPNARVAKLVAHALVGCTLTVGVDVLPLIPFSDYQPKLTADGRFLFFTSTRPYDDTGEPVRQNVWFTSRKSRDVSWQAPRIVEDLISPMWDGHAVLTRKNNLYFAWERPGGIGMVDIYKARNHYRSLIQKNGNCRPRSIRLKVI